MVVVLKGERLGGRSRDGWRMIQVNHERQTTTRNRGVGGVKADGWLAKASERIGSRGSRVGAMRSLNPFSPSLNFCLFLSVR